MNIRSSEVTNHKRYIRLVSGDHGKARTCDPQFRKQVVSFRHNSKYNNENKSLLLVMWFRDLPGTALTYLWRYVDIGGGLGETRLLASFLSLSDEFFNSKAIDVIKQQFNMGITGQWQGPGI